ncbi:Endonuclease/exonuclease/phosphatase [Gongronella butleri]|nr:Endonuclease/exonuclease/phosphatase [Gongronella butleri]
MRIVTWNVNGLATTLQYHPWSDNKSYKFLLDSLMGDIICLQEVKTQRQKLTRDQALVPGYDGYFSFPKSKHGYSGVATYVRQPLQPVGVDDRITHGLDPEFLDALNTPAELLDQEGRCLIMDFGLFVIFNVYFPNGGGDDTRFDYKMDYHACALQKIDQLLANGRAVILVGDINAVRSTLDHADPEGSNKDWGVTDFMEPPHRQWLDNLVDPKGPLVDVCRRSFPDRKGMYTCWNLLTNARPANFGTRIDYVLVSRDLLPWVDKADIQPEILGSDHCPVYVDLHDTRENGDLSLRSLLTAADATSPASTCPFLAANYSEFRQKKLSSFFGKKSDAPIPSTPLMPSPSSTSAPANLSLKRKAPSTNVPVPGKRLSSSQRSVASFFATTRPPSSVPPPTPANSAPTSTTTSQSSLSDDMPQADVPEDDDIQAMIHEIDNRHEKQQDWAKLFRPRSVPTCTRHKAPCIEYTVNKKGPNKGRHFYLCSLPIGPSTEKDSDEFRCDYFQWKHEKPRNER